MPPMRLQPARPTTRSGAGPTRRRLRLLAAVSAAALVGLDGVAAVVTGGAARAATPSRPVVSWTSPAAGATPPPLAYAAAAYDADNSTVVLFGGVTSDGSVSDQTWIWNGTSWRLAHPSLEPPARYLAAMAFDPALHQLILFGGQSSDGTLLNDTWAWNGAAWVQQTGGDTIPAARESSSFAYDNSGNLLLYGGTGYAAAPATTPTSSSSSTTTVPGIQEAPALGGETVLGDTWQWTSKGWVQSSVPGPPARSGAVLAYDQANGSTVLFGGESTPASATAARPLGDTWVWSSGRWAQVRPSASPSARYGAVADGFVPLGGALLVSGEGVNGNLADAWLWTGSNWVPVSVQGHAPGREGGAAAYDAATQQMVLFGGRGGGGGTLGDTGLIKPVPTGAPTTTVPRTTTTLAGTTTTLRPHTGPGHSTSPTTRGRPATSVTTKPRTGTTSRHPVAVPAPAGTLLLETSVNRVKRGGSVWIAGGGFAPGSRITVTFHSRPALLGWATAGSDGRFATTVAVPDHAVPGEHHIIASGTAAAGGTTDLTAAVLVLAPSHQRTSTFTTLFLVGLALLIPVAAFLAMAGMGAWRRRREAGGAAGA